MVDREGEEQGSQNQGRELYLLDVVSLFTTRGKQNLCYKTALVCQTTTHDIEITGIIASWLHDLAHLTSNF